MADVNKGLNKWAREFLARKPILVYTEHVTREYPDGRQEVMTPCPVYQSNLAEEINREDWDLDEDEKAYCYATNEFLKLYTFSDGSTYRLTIQKVLIVKVGWFSSNSTYFLALKNDATGYFLPESFWTEEEMELAK